MCLYTSWRTNRRHAPRACAVYSRQARRGGNQSETELRKLFRKCLHLVSLGVEEGISSLLHEPSAVLQHLGRTVGTSVLAQARHDSIPRGPRRVPEHVPAACLQPPSLGCRSRLELRAKGLRAKVVHLQAALELSQ